jgi:hypothetical protein
MAEQGLIEEQHVEVNNEKRVGYGIEDAGMGIITQKPRADLASKWKLP